MKFGIAGVHYGHFGMIVKDALQNDEVEVVGIAEADEALRAQWCETCACDGFTRVEDMLEHTEPDVVVEGSRVDEKAGLVRLCADSGTHLILDKPLGLSLEELEAMAAAVRQSGIELSMYFTLRYWPPFVGLKQVMDEGKLGKIVTMISTHPHKLGAIRRHPAWMYERVIVTGTEGTATLRAWTESELEVALTGTGAEQLPMPTVELKQFVDDFVTAIKAGNAPPISNRDVFQTAHACLLARESADNGGVPVSIPAMWA